MSDIEYLQIAIELAVESYEKGIFPSGAVLVCGDEIIAEHLASPFPNAHLHSDSKCIDEAMEKLGRRLDDCTLYSSMEPCIMCLGRAYWSGLRRSVFAVSKDKLPIKYCYIISESNDILMNGFNEKIEMINTEDLEGEIFPVIMNWIEDMKSKK